MIAEMAPTMAPSNAGISQFEVVGGVVFTSSNTSPGVAKTFNRRAASDVVGGGGAAGIGGWSSMRLFAAGKMPQCGLDVQRRELPAAGQKPAVPWSLLPGALVVSFATKWK